MPKETRALWAYMSWGTEVGKSTRVRQYIGHPGREGEQSIPIRSDTVSTKSLKEPNIRDGRGRTAGVLPELDTVSSISCPACAFERAKHLLRESSAVLVTGYR